MIRLPNAPGSLPPTPCVASVTIPMHFFVGTALATSNTRLSSCRGLTEKRLAEGKEGICRRGCGAHRVVEPHRPVATRRRRYRLDRQFILFHPSRSQPQAAIGPAARRAGRRLASPRRGLLPHGEV